MTTLNSPSVLSAALDEAFRAAFLLTGNMESAGNAVLNGIDGLDCNGDLQNALVVQTARSVIRQRGAHRSKSLPAELRELDQVSPGPRDAFVLRVLIGLPAATSAAILNLSIEEFGDALSAAFQQLTVPGR